LTDFQDYGQKCTNLSGPNPITFSWQKGKGWGIILGVSSDALSWLEQSKSDFEDAQLLWKNHRYGASVLFSQQSVEKIIKAYIVHKQKVVPRKTHRIEVLLEDAKLTPENPDKELIKELSKGYIRVRYPDLNKLYYRKKEKAVPLVKAARELYLWVEKKFKQR
jgi:HEPN domain-containing protein